MATKKSAKRVRVHIENVSSYHKHVQITQADYAQAAKRHRDIARRVDVSIGWDYKDFDAKMRDADVLVFMGLDFKPERFAERAPELRWIQMTSAGVEHIMPFDWLPAHVVMTNNSGVHAEKHGEFGITAVLMLNNNVPVMTTNQRQARWQTVFGTSIRGKTLAVIGVGSIGRHGGAPRQAPGHARAGGAAQRRKASSGGRDVPAFTTRSRAAAGGFRGGHSSRYGRDPQSA